MNKSLNVRKILHENGPMLVDNPVLGCEPSIYDILRMYYERIAQFDGPIATIYVNQYMDNLINRINNA